MYIATAQLLSEAEPMLADAGCDSPRGDSYLLLAHALDVPCETLLGNPGIVVPSEVAERYREFVRRRAAREPTAYITGLCTFRKLRLEVDGRVLVPYLETELLVAAGAQLPRGVEVVDVGTGSGAVALALKHERPDLRITATDISESALEVAKANGARLGLEVEWRQADLLDGLPDEFDAVLANLPYYPSEPVGQVAPELTDHEPALAVFTASDELALIRALLEQIAGRPRVGTVVLETGAGQVEAVSELLVQAGFHSVRRGADLTGVQRGLAGYRSVASRSDIEVPAHSGLDGAGHAAAHVSAS
jgi:release factor glutamine methyltransferase